MHKTLHVLQQPSASTADSRFSTSDSTNHQQLATLPLGPFLCLHLLLGTIYLQTFVLSTPYPPSLNAT